MDRLVGNFLSQGLLPDDRELVGKTREGVDSPIDLLGIVYPRAPKRCLECLYVYCSAEWLLLCLW